MTLRWYLIPSALGNHHNQTKRNDRHDDGMLIEQGWTNRWSLCSEPVFQGLHFLLQVPVALFSRRKFGEQAVAGDSVFGT